MNKTFDLKIINKNDYKIYYFDIKIDKTTNKGFLPTINDIHTWIIMTENFFELLIMLSNSSWVITFTLPLE